MSKIIIASWDADGRITAYADAERIVEHDGLRVVLVDGTDNLAIIKSEGNSEAFIADLPDAPFEDWRVVNGTLTVEDGTARRAEVTRRANIIDQIVSLERQRTPRRLAESRTDDLGGTQEGRDWWKANVDAIVLLRSQL